MADPIDERMVVSAIQPWPGHILAQPSAQQLEAAFASLAQSSAQGEPPGGTLNLLE
ncbi:MAG: hypothetical protein AB7V46_07070 [Thermomicrobiales bacterium]